MVSLVHLLMPLALEWRVDPHRLGQDGLLTVYLLVLPEAHGLQEQRDLISPRLKDAGCFSAHSRLNLVRLKLVGIFHFVNFGTRWRWKWISFPVKWLKSDFQLRS